MRFSTIGIIHFRTLADSGTPHRFMSDESGVKPYLTPEIQACGQNRRGSPRRALIADRLVGSQMAHEVVDNPDLLRLLVAKNKHGKKWSVPWCD